ncbi:hypothetical protein VH567_11315 [Sphingomonas sp. 4RDLI-65]|uniref:hypothetical protein n=1 Tax=Sphingomonas sp. 4RDLI-65 TaxID=3111641 RepID=UPI003C2156E3
MRTLARGSRRINYRGNTLPFAPKWTGSADASYEIPLGDHSLSFNTNWSIRSRIFFNPDKRPESDDPSRAIGNVRVSYGQADGSWRLRS